MKYKVGDKVKIKTWEVMEKKYGLDDTNSINRNPYYFGDNRESYINKHFPDRIFEITTIEKSSYDKKSSYYYLMKNEEHWKWTDYMIECLASEYKEPIPILSRFEILDL